jgi:hypothetical protein
MRIINSRELCVGMIIIEIKRPTSNISHCLWPSVVIANIDDNDIEFFDSWYILYKHKIENLYIKSTELITIL